MSQVWAGLTSLALDMTNFATYIDASSGRAPIAQRAKRNRGAPICGWSVWLVVARDGGSADRRAYPGNKPDVTQFAAMIGELADRHRGLGADPKWLTVVFDAGQNSDHELQPSSTRRACATWDRCRPRITPPARRAGTGYRPVAPALSPSCALRPR